MIVSKPPATNLVFLSTRPLRISVLRVSLETFENPECGLAAAVAESLGLSGIVVDILAAMPLRGRALRTMGPAVRKAIGFPQRQRLSREELFEFHLVICLSLDKQGAPE